MFLKKLDVICVVIVCICLGVKCCNGMFICFNDNVVVVINKEGNLCGICVFGLVVCELCDCFFGKIVFLVLEVL